MSRIIMVDVCMDCPYVSCDKVNVGYTEQACSHPEYEYREIEIDIRDSIPDWCPLDEE